MLPTQLVTTPTRIDREDEYRHRGVQVRCLRVRRQGAAMERTASANIVEGVVRITGEWRSGLDSDTILVSQFLAGRLVRGYL
jgi:hypothetical protein